MKKPITNAKAVTKERKLKEVINAADKSVIGTVTEVDEADVQKAIQVAQKAKLKMAKLPAHQRARALFRCADEIELSKDELAVLLASENGKPIRQTREEIAASIRIFRGFAEESKRLFGRSMSLDMIPGMEQHFAFTVLCPVGVVAAIIPFNYPVELYAHKAAAALAAGNAVIVKPPSDCPLTLLRIAEIVEQSGLPQGAHQMITGPGNVVGEYLACSPGVDLITVTGSTAVGKRISQLAAETLKRVHLELGGNDPTIICVDADLEKAAEGIILGRLARGNGQICCAVKRIFVDIKVYDAFAEILAGKAKTLKVGDQLKEDTDVGPLINESAAKQVEAAINGAVAAGAKIKAGGHRSGCFIEPTVLTDVHPEVDLFREETFGPVAPLVAFKDVDEAVKMANDSHYGLQAAVFTKDISKAFDIAYRLEAGGVIINWSSAVRSENLPFGGIKLSGHGRESIHDTLKDMTEQKSILVYDAINIFNT